MAEDETHLTIAVPVALAQRWEELRRRARFQGGATDETAEVDMIIAWAFAEAARRSRD